MVFLILNLDICHLQNKGTTKYSCPCSQLEHLPFTEQGNNQIRPSLCSLKTLSHQNNTHLYLSDRSLYLIDRSLYLIDRSLYLIDRSPHPVTDLLVLSQKEQRSNQIRKNPTLPYTLGNNRL